MASGGSHGASVREPVLYEHLFDEDDDTLSNLLDVQVSNLRKRLGAEFIRGELADLHRFAWP